MSFEELFQQMHKEEEEILITKGREYTIGTPDRFHNFRTVASFMGITPQQALAVYLYKHMASVFSYIKSGRTYSTETILSRIEDARNYLALLAGLIAEEENGNKNETD